MIEILVVSTIVALLAGASFPLLQLIRQREKERRLRIILDNVRSSIYGSRTVGAGRSISDGYRNYIIRQIMAANIPEASKSFAIRYGTAGGLLFPLDPSRVENSVGAAIPPVQTGTGTLPLSVNRRFLRRIPPHPFLGWYPQAHWQFKFATGPVGDGWVSSWPINAATGVVNIRSFGAGIAIDGSNTNNW